MFLSHRQEEVSISRVVIGELLKPAHFSECVSGWSPVKMHVLALVLGVEAAFLSSFWALGHTAAESASGDPGAHAPV